MGTSVHGPFDPQPPRAVLRTALPTIHRLDTVVSTQDEAAARWDAAGGRGREAPFAVLAREQTAGRGRLGRRFVSPPGGALALTVAHRTALAPGARTWFPLATGLAVIDALTAVCGTRVATGPQALGLKWPNDIHTWDGRKLGGILVEGRGADGVLVGVGLNLLGPIRDADGAVVPGAIWLLGPGGLLGQDTATAAEVDDLRERIGTQLAAAVCRELSALESAGGDAQETSIMRRYTMSCLTLGGMVRVDQLGGPGTGGSVTSLRGIAREVDAHGRLVVDLEEGGRVAVDVGDVRHLRPGHAAGTARGTRADVEQQEEYGT